MYRELQLLNKGLLSSAQHMLRDAQVSKSTNKGLLSQSHRGPIGHFTMAPKKGSSYIWKASRWAGFSVNGAPILSSRKIESWNHSMSADISSSVLEGSDSYNFARILGQDYLPTRAPGMWGTGQEL